MNDLSKDLLDKIKNLYEQKKFSKLETTIENIKNFEGLPTNLQMIYAVSKALIYPNSKIQDYKKSAFFYFEKKGSFNNFQIKKQYQDLNEPFNIS